MKIKNCKRILGALSAALLMSGCTKVTPTSSIGGSSSIFGPDGGAKYTYNTYLSTSPSTWNVHTWETSDESYIPAFTEMGFYDLQLNAAKDGYEIVCEMASAMPEDVSATVDESDLQMYGYKGNVAEGYVWDIALNKNACWEDGTPIKAVDYVESMKRQLDPKMANYRADSYYESSFVIANADRYFKQGNETLEEAYKYLDKTNGKWTTDAVSSDGIYYLNPERATSFYSNIFSNVDEPDGIWNLLDQPSYYDNNAAAKLAAGRILDAIVYHDWKYEDHKGDYESDWEEIHGWGDLSKVKEEMCNYDIDIDLFDEEEVYVRNVYSGYTEETLERYSTSKLKADLSKLVANFYSGMRDSSWNWKAPLFIHIYNDYTQEWGDEDGATSGVGLVAVEPYKLRLYLAKQVTALDLKFSLSGNWLVKNDLYDKLTINQAGVKSTSYATPEKGVEGYMSYGPYKLTHMENGKSFTIEKNDKWYGYTDGKHVGQYQMTGVYTRIIKEHETARSEFLAGRIDDIELNRNDMKSFGNSSRLTRTFESYTQKISFNSDRASLLGRQENAKKNKVILANKDFREGLSLAMDRNNFASQATSGSKPFTALLNDLYLTDVEDGEMYRNTAQGKSVYNRVYGELGGNPYDTNYTPKALTESEQGYNMNMATWYVAKALKDEFNSTESGHLEKGSDTKIDLEFRVYDDKSESTLEMTNFIESQWNTVLTNAVAKLREDGTLTAQQNVSLELTLLKDEDYYTHATNGVYDLIFSTWGGAAINPQGLMEVYCKKSFTQTCEYGFKGKQDKAYVEIDQYADGNVERKSVDEWYTILMDIAETDEKGSAAWNKKHQQILNIMSALEVYIISRFEAVPLIARATSSLNSFKIENGSESYINLIGYGGIRHMTFNYTDAEWDQFVKDHPNLENLYKD